MSETTTAAPVDEALESARWDLEPLVEGQGDEGAIALLDEAQSRAESFAERYRGKVPELDAGALAGALTELEEIGDRVGRAGTYASLAFSVDTQTPEVAR